MEFSKYYIASVFGVDILPWEKYWFFSILFIYLFIYLFIWIIL